MGSAWGRLVDPCPESDSLQSCTQCGLIGWHVQLASGLSLRLGWCSSAPTPCCGCGILKTSRDDSMERGAAAPSGVLAPLHGCQTCSCSLPSPCPQTSRRPIGARRWRPFGERSSRRHLPQRASRGCSGRGGRRSRERWCVACGVWLGGAEACSRDAGRAAFRACEMRNCAGPGSHVRLSEPWHCLPSVCCRSCR